MRTHLLLEWTVGGIARIKRVPKESVWFFMFSRKEELKLTARDNLLKHMLQGRDSSDPRSAGGFNGPESPRSR